jgi:hypothetical protein
MIDKKIICSIILILLVFVGRSYGQHTDTTRRAAIKRYSLLLETDSATSVKVRTVYDAYKAAVKKVWSSSSLTDMQKHSQITVLIDEKNRKLGELLTARQMERIVPTTERRRTWKPDTTARTRQR